MIEPTQKVTGKMQWHNEWKVVGRWAYMQGSIGVSQGTADTSHEYLLSACIYTSITICTYCFKSTALDTFTTVQLKHYVN